MIVPTSSRSSYRKPGTFGTIDYYYRTFNAKLGEYILPIAGAFFVILTLFSDFHVPIPSLSLTASELHYIWMGAFIALIITLALASIKYIKPHIKYRKLWIVLATVGGLFLVVGLMNVFGIVPLFSVVEPIYNIPQGTIFTCPSNAQYYGAPGCQIVIGYDQGFTSVTCSDTTYCSSVTSSGQLVPGATFTCPTSINSYTDIACSAQYALVTTPTVSTVKTTFTESGLPNQGQNWYVTYDGGRQGNYPGQSIVFTTNTGTYSYSVGPIYPSGYEATPSSGSLSAGSTQNIVFTQVTTTTQNQTSTGTISGTISTTSINLIGYITDSISNYFHI